jgi:hypothetical protein
MTKKLTSNKKHKLGRQYKIGEGATSITLDIYGHVMPDSQERMMEALRNNFEAAIEQSKNKRCRSV